jgi:hypothetical protein
MEASFLGLVDKIMMTKPYTIKNRNMNSNTKKLEIAVINWLQIKASWKKLNSFAQTKRLWRKWRNC